MHVDENVTGFCVRIAFILTRSSLFRVENCIKTKPRKFVRLVTRYNKIILLSIPDDKGQEPSNSTQKETYFGQFQQELACCAKRFQISFLRPFFFFLEHK